HVTVDALARVVAGDVLDQPRRQEADAVERAAVRHHLVEGGHRPRGRVAATRRRTRAAELDRVLLGAPDLTPAIGTGLVHVDGPLAFAFGETDEELAAEAERLGDVVADERAIVGLRERFDQDGRGPVGRAAVIV